MKYLALFLALSFSLPLHAFVLELRDQQTMATNNLTLNDLIASSQGVSAQDLTSVIGATPALGQQQTWTRDQIAAALPSDLKQLDLQWAGSTSCVVSRPSVDYKPSDVQSLILTELGQRLPQNSNFSIVEIPGLEVFPVPAGPLDTHVDFSASTMRSEWGDATIQFSVQGQVAVSKNVRFHWAYTRLVWQVTGQINNGDPLAATSFQQVEANILKIPGMFQPAIDFPDSKIAAHPMSQGKILMENDWVEPVLVARNDLVTI